MRKTSGSSSTKRIRFICVGADILAPEALSVANRILLALIRITARMLGVPCPGSAHDIFESREFRFPLQFIGGFGRRGDQLRRITGAARLLDRGNFLAG